MIIPDWRLTRNAAYCTLCHDEIESTHRHDFVTCRCGNLSVDGGMAYVRRSGTLENYKEMCEYERYWRKPFVGVDDEKVSWLRENEFPEYGDWSQEQEVLYKLTWE